MRELCYIASISICGGKYAEELINLYNKKLTPEREIGKISGRPVMDAGDPNTARTFMKLLGQDF